MSGDRKGSRFNFEGQMRTVAEIEAEFLQGIPTGTLYSRLKASGATTKAEYVAWLARPPVKSKPNPEYLAEQHRRVQDARFNREVRARADAITGEKGCNYCHLIKPMEKLKPIRRGGGRIGLICDTCSAARNKALSARPDSTNSGGGNKQ